MQTEITEILKYADKAGVLLPILICIVVIVYTPNVIQLFNTWKMRKINYLTTLHNNEFLTEDIQKMLKDEINNAAFQSIHGIHTGTLLREQLTKLHNQDRDTFTWRQIRFASPYIEAGEKEVIVKIDWFSTMIAILSIFGLITTILLYAMSWASLILQKDWHSLITIVIYTVMFTILFFMFAYQLTQYQFAKKLKKAIELKREMHND